MITTLVGYATRLDKDKARRVDQMIADTLEQRLFNPVLNNKLLNTRPVEKTEAKVQFEMMKDYLKNGDTKGFILARENYFSIKIDYITSEIKKNNSKNAYNSLVSLRGLIADSTNPDDVINKALGAHASGKAQKHVDAEVDSNRTIPMESMIVNIDKVEELHGKAREVVDDVHQFYLDRQDFPDMPGCDENDYVLLTGEPGTGKTTIAKVLAHRMNADLILVDPGQIRSSGYGESAARMRDILEQAAQHRKETGKPTILFIDEVDQIARARDNNSHEATQSILSELLVYMNGIQGVKSGLDIMMLFATNCEDMIDTALKSRAEIINIPIPDFTTRYRIVKSLLDPRSHRVSVTDNQIMHATKHTEPHMCVKDGINYCFCGRDLKHAIKKASKSALKRFRSGIDDAPLIQIEDLIHAFKQEIGSLSVIYTAPQGEQYESHPFERTYGHLHGTYQR